MASFFAKKSSKSRPETKHPILKWFGRFFMGIGIMVCVSLILSIVSFSLLFGGKKEAKPLPKDFVLAHSLYGTLADVNNVNPLFAQFAPPQTSLYGFLQSLKAAKKDDRVKALVIKIHDGDYSMTQISDLRDAIMDFRVSGKKAYAYSDSFGGFSNGIGEYWLATAFDEIWVQPIGTVSINGIRIEQPFFKDALDKIGVTMEMEQRKNYKTGPEMYTRNQMSSYNQETIEAIVDDVMTRMGDDIHADRQITKAELKAAIDKSPLSAEEALSMKLIDKIGYIDELEDVLKGEESKDQDDIFVALPRYKQDAMNAITFTKKTEVALVMVNGAIVDADVMAKSNHPMAFLMPTDVADSNVIAGAMNEIVDNKDIKIVILRINSPGGAPTASETIRRGVVELKKAGKFVIVSMADVAASGGYWIATDADIIFADNLTLTGSIGVYGGKPDLSGLWDKLGVSWGAVEYGQNASMWSTNKGMSASERARLNAMMDNIYNAFIKRVSEGRGMEASAVEKVAQGRAWTGQAAQLNGLVDAIGGFEVALDHAAKKIGLDGDDAWTTLSMGIYPRAEDPFSDIAKLLGIPSIKDTPKLPSIFLPSIVNDAVITAPYLRVEF